MKKLILILVCFALVLSACDESEVIEAIEKIESEPVLSGLSDIACDNSMGDLVRHLIINQIQERIGFWPDDGLLCEVIGK